MQNATVSTRARPRAAVVELIAYCVMAASIGLAASITLAAVVMLLAQADASAPAQVRLPLEATRLAALDRISVPGEVGRRLMR